MQTEMVVPQHLRCSQTVHRVGAADPAAGQVHRPGEGGDGRGGAGRVALRRRGVRCLRHHLEHLPPGGRRGGRPHPVRGAAAGDGAGYRRDQTRQGEVGNRSRHRGADVGGPVRHRPGGHQRRSRPVGAGQRRDVATVVDWIQAQSQKFRAGITHVAIDMSASYAKAVRRALPHARIVIDHFHLVKLANQMIDETSAAAPPRPYAVAGGGPATLRVDQPPAAAPRRRTPHRRATPQDVRQARHLRPRRGSPRSVDHQRAAPQGHGLQVPRRAELRDPRRPGGREPQISHRHGCRCSQPPRPYQL